MDSNASHPPQRLENGRERFDRLVWPVRDVVLRTSLYLTHDRDEAEDLAQETLLKAFRGIDSFAEGTDVKSWLLRILRNSRIDRLRKAAVHRRDISLDDLGDEPESAGQLGAAPPESSTASAAIMEQFSDEQVLQALKQLPEEIRWTLLLVDVQGLDQVEAAKVLHVPVGTVKSRAHRGRAMLRASLTGMAKDLRLTS